MPKISDPQSNQEQDISEGILKQGFFVIGRGALTFMTNDMRGVSRNHATIFEYFDGLYLIDHSKNGTWYMLPGQPIAQVYNVITKSNMALSQCEAERAKKEGAPGRILPDRKSIEKYEEDVANFLVALRDTSQRENFAAFCPKLQDGTELYFGHKDHGYVFRT